MPLPLATVLTTLTDKLSEYSNKPPNQSLAKSVASFHIRNNDPERLSRFLAALGVTDPQNAMDIHNFISDSLDILKPSLLTVNSDSAPLKSAHSHPLKSAHSDPQVSPAVPPQPSTKTGNTNKREATAGPPKRPRQTLEQDFEEEIGHFTIAKSTVDLDLDLILDAAPKKADAKPPIKFKKIRKEDAARLRNTAAPEPAFTTHGTSTSNTTKSTESDPHAPIKHEQPLSPQYPEKMDLDMASMDYDIENDREWYDADETGHARDTSSYHDDFDTDSRSRFTKKKSPNPYKSGGHYDPESGQYVDYDHLTPENDALRIKITNHTLIPPFLEDSQEFLQIQLGGALKSLGPTVDPIKDPASDLAIAARCGSEVVKERQTRQERAKQARERSDMSGTRMGKVVQSQNSLDVKVIEPKLSHDLEPCDPISISTQRASLPAFAVKNELVRIISENQVTIVIGETGLGKTTQLTQYLNEAGFCKSIDRDGVRRMIGCTQPRRVAAMLVAKRVAQEMNCAVGQEVGFSIRFEDETNPRKTIIKYMTEGVLLREILMNPLLEQYSCIIMDEAHERSLNTDVLLGLFKTVLANRKDLKLIVTSATMNAERFSLFFADAPLFTIPGRTFPVDVLFSKSGNTDYVDAAVKQILTIHLQSWSPTTKNDGDILVFMTGQQDIEATCELLAEKLELLESPPPIDILPIYSALPADVQKRIFAKKNIERRKVVVATNIAEASLTVDGVKYVVDCGLAKLKVYNPKLGMDALQVIPISLANAQQRSGRAGRTGPGIAYRLYTELASDPDHMYAQPIPEIQRTNLSNVLLLLKSLKVDDISKFNFLDPPPPDLVSCSLYELWAMDALDNLGCLTALGRDMVKFPMEPLLSRAILLSCRPQFHCSEEIVTIVALLSVPPIFSRPKERADDADLARERFAVADSDHLTLLNVFVQFEKHSSKNGHKFHAISSWCSRNFVLLKSLVRARDIKNQLSSILQKQKLPVLRARSDQEVRKCLAASFYHQLAKLSKTNLEKSPEFTNMRHQYMKMYLHPTSSLKGSEGSCSYVVYHELILTTREYMSCVTAVEPLWLLEYGYKFYGVAPPFRQQVTQMSQARLISKLDLEQELERDSKVYRERQQSQRARTRDLTSGRSSTRRAFAPRRAL